MARSATWPGARAWLVAASVVGCVSSLPSAAQAATVRLWSCHGPAGQPLGADSLSTGSTGDGAVAAVAGGCAGGAPDAAMRATLEPIGGVVAPGSSARYTFTLPVGITPLTASMPWTVAGVARSAPASTGLRVQASSGANVLAELSSDVPGGPSTAGPADAALDGRTVTVAVSCASITPCVASGPEPAPSVSVRELTVLGSDERPPEGSAYVMTEPVRDRTLRVRINASDAGVGLGRAIVLIDGAEAAAVDLSGGCTDLQPGGVLDLSATALCQPRVIAAPIDIDLTGQASGLHTLEVVVADALGNRRSFLGQSFVIADAPSGPQQTEVTLNLSAGKPAAGSATGAGEGAVNVLAETASGGAGSCASPQLSVRLVSKPLGVRGSRVIVRRGALARFRGRITCLVAGRRGAPPVGTRVEVASFLPRRPKAEMRRPVVRKDGSFVWAHSVTTDRRLRFRIKGAKAKLAVVHFQLLARTPAQVARSRRSER